MLGLALEEWFTLELVAEQGEDTVVDGRALATLESRGLVTLDEDGWDVTPLGLFVIHELA